MFCHLLHFGVICLECLKYKLVHVLVFSLAGNLSVEQSMCIICIGNVRKCVNSILV